MKNFQTKLIAVAMVAAMAVSGMSVPAFAAGNDTSSTGYSTSTSSTQQNGTAVITTFGVDGEASTITVDLSGKDAEKEVQVPLEAVFPVQVNSSAAVSFNCGDKAVATAGTTKAFSAGTTFFNIMPWGKVGDKTGVYANGVKLFTMVTVKAPFTCDTSDTVRLNQTNAKHLFQITTNSTDTVSANTANGKVVTVDSAAYNNTQYKTKDNGDGTKTVYFYARALQSSYWPTGVYAQINGGTYRLFVSSSSTGSTTGNTAPSSSTVPAATGTGSSAFVCDTSGTVEKSCYGAVSGAHNNYTYKVTADKDAIVTSSVDDSKVASVSKTKEEVKNGKRNVYFKVVAKPYTGDLYHYTETQNKKDALGKKSVTGQNADGYQETSVMVKVNNEDAKKVFTFATTVNPDLTLPCYDEYKWLPTCGAFLDGRCTEKYGDAIGAKVSQITTCLNPDTLLRTAKYLGLKVGDTPKSDSIQIKYVKGSSRPEDGHGMLIEHVNSNTTVAFSEGSTVYQPNAVLSLAYLTGFTSHDFDGARKRSDGVYVNIKTGEVYQGGIDCEAYSYGDVIFKYVYLK